MAINLHSLATNNTIDLSEVDVARMICAILIRNLDERGLPEAIAVLSDIAKRACGRHADAPGSAPTPGQHQGRGGTVG
jgi:hypothetical protein